MTWTAPEVVRTDWPQVGDERAMLTGLLDWHRETLQIKCSGLTGEQLRRRSIDPSWLSLLGLVRHLTDVERGWFWDFAGQPWAAEDLAWQSAEGIGADFGRVDAADPEADLTAYRHICARSNELVAAASLDDTFTYEDGRTFSLRWVFLHMIEEYARHNGHADVLRERIDGSTGE